MAPQYWRANIIATVRGTAIARKQPGTAPQNPALQNVGEWQVRSAGREEQNQYSVPERVLIVVHVESSNRKTELVLQSGVGTQDPAFDTEFRFVGFEF